MTARGANELTTDFAEPPLQLAAIVGRVFAHRSGSQNKLVAEGGRDGTSGFEQRFEMSFGSLLKAKCGFASVATVSVTARQ